MHKRVIVSKTEIHISSEQSPVECILKFAETRGVMMNSKTKDQIQGHCRTVSRTGQIQGQSQDVKDTKDGSRTSGSSITAGPQGFSRSIYDFRS